MATAAAGNISEDGIFDDDVASPEGALEDVGIFDEETDGATEGADQEEAEEEEEGTPDYAFDEGSDDDHAAAPGRLGIASTGDARSPALGSSAPAPLSLGSGAVGAGGGRGLLAATSEGSPLFAALSSASGQRAPGTSCWSPRVHPGSHQHVQNLVAERLFGAKPPPAQRKRPDARVVQRLLEPRKAPAKYDEKFTFRPTVRQNSVRKRMDKDVEDTMPRWQRLAMPNTASAKKLVQEQEAKEKKEMEQCTFTPELTQSTRTLATPEARRRSTNRQSRASEIKKLSPVLRPSFALEKRRAPPKYATTAVRTKKSQPGLAAYSRHYAGFAPHVGEDFIMEDPVFQELHNKLKALKC